MARFGWQELACVVQPFNGRSTIANCQDAGLFVVALEDFKADGDGHSNELEEVVDSLVAKQGAGTRNENTSSPPFQIEPMRCNWDGR